MQSTFYSRTVLHLCEFALLIAAIITSFQWMTSFINVKSHRNVILKHPEEFWIRLRETKRNADSLSDTGRASQQNQTRLTFYPMGRTGNRMFQIASLVGISSQNNMEYCIPGNIPYLECFVGIYKTKQSHNTCEDKLFPKLFQNSSIKLQDLSFDRTSCHLKNSKRTENYLVIKSLMQSWKYFCNVDDTMRRLFKFAPKHNKVAVHMLQQVFNNATKTYITSEAYDTGKTKGRNNSYSYRNSKFTAVHPNLLLTLVCVQIRRKDFISEYAHLINPITGEYLFKAMYIFAKTFSWPVFIIVSDDIAWCKEMLQGKFENLYFSKKHTPCEDLAILSQCQHSIISPGSSFGWWGAYLANGHTIYYSDWLKTGKWYNIHFEAKDYFLPRWTELDRTSNGK